jgi:hypothetical protein
VIWLELQVCPYILLTGGCRRNWVSPAAAGAHPETVSTGATREYWIIYRGPGFFAVVRIGSTPTPSPPPLPSASCLSFSVFLFVAGRAYKRERGGGYRGWGRSQIMRRGESLVLYKSFSTLRVFAMDQE